MSGQGNAFSDITDLLSAAPRRIKNTFVDLMGPKQTGPMSYEQQMLDAKRQQALADALMKQSSDDIPIQSYKGIQAPIPWSAILGKALQGAGASYRANQAQETQEKADTSDVEDMNKRIELLTQGRKTLTSPHTDLDATAPQLPGAPAPPTQMTQLALPDTEGNINPQYGRQKLSPEEIMAEAIRAGGPKTEAAMAVAAPRLWAQQDKAEARAQTVKDKTLRHLSPQEAAQRGYRPGTVVSVDPFGNESVDQTPDTLSPGAEQQRIRIAEAGRSPNAGQGSWGQPVVEIGPDGKPIQVRYNSQGGRMVVQGAVPKDASRMLGPNALKSIETVGGKLEALGRLRSTYKPEFSGNITGDFGNWATRNNPFGGASPQTDWWQGYNEYVAKVRNELFGASLTPGEAEEFNKFIITPRMNPEIAQSNLKRQYQITARAAQRTANPYVKQGYNQEAVEAAMGGMTLDELNKIDTRVAQGQPETPNPQQQRTGPTAEEAAAELKRRRAAKGQR